MPQAADVTLDLPSQAAWAEQNPLDFLKAHGEPLIIDEIQYAPSLFRHLKSAIDQDRHPGRFLLTSLLAAQMMGFVRFNRLPRVDIGHGYG